MRPRFTFVAAALLAAITIMGARTARADVDITLTISDSLGSATAIYDFTTSSYSSGPTYTGTGNSGTSFTYSSNPITGTSTLGFTGTIGGVYFDLSVAGVTNSPGTTSLSTLNLNTGTIANTSTAAGSAISITTSASGYTAPTGTVTASSTMSGSLTAGNLTSGSFTASSDIYNPAVQSFSASGNDQSFSATNSAVTLTNFGATTPYSASETIGFTLAASTGANTQEVSGITSNLTLSAAVVPEPSTLAIAGLGALGFGAHAWRRVRKGTK